MPASTTCFPSAKASSSIWDHSRKSRPENTPSKTRQGRRRVRDSSQHETHGGSRAVPHTVTMMPATRVGDTS
jgi:hypothetical protein